MRKDPSRVSQDRPHHVENVRSEYHQVLSARPEILLAAPANLVDLADFAGFDHLEGLQRERRPAHLVSELDLDTGFAYGVDHPVGVRQSSGEGLFEIHVATRPSCRRHHLQPLVGMPRTDADDVRLLLVEQFAEVSVVGRGAGALLGLRAALGIGIGDGHDPCLGECRPDIPDAVAEVAAAGMADHAHPVACLGAQRKRSRARSDEEMPATHGQTISAPACPGNKPSGWTLSAAVPDQVSTALAGRLPFPQPSKPGSRLSESRPRSRSREGWPPHGRPDRRAVNRPRSACPWGPPRSWPRVRRWVYGDSPRWRRRSQVPRESARPAG